MWKEVATAAFVVGVVTAFWVKKQPAHEAEGGLKYRPG